jgi:hypothetical protein
MNLQGVFLLAFLVMCCQTSIVSLAETGGWESDYRDTLIREKSMRSSTKPIYTEEVRQSAMASSYPVLYDLLEACKSMLSLCKEGHAGTPGSDSILQSVERAITRAENELNRGWKKHPLQKSGFFGRMGNHYDFEIHLSKVQERQKIYRCEGRDRVGRLVVVRIVKDEEPLSLESGETIFFRGKIADHRLFHSEPVTFIDVTSGVLKI